jgi:hypothetical protein
VAGFTFFFSQFLFNTKAVRIRIQQLVDLLKREKRIFYPRILYMYVNTIPEIYFQK